MAETGAQASREGRSGVARRGSRRPAFYALTPGGWRDLVTILHPPYTAWHLSYVALGAAAAPELRPVRLWAALGAFFLAVGVAAHALDELHGHPLGTRLSDRTLAVLAGIAGLFVVSVTLLPFIVVGAFAVVAYNLELFGGRFHTDFWFAAAWGAFPAATGYWANALTLEAAGVLAVIGCFGLSVAQRRLSTPVRELRRSTISVSGEQRLADGEVVELNAERLAAPLDGALRALSLAVVALAAGLVALRL